MVSARVEGIQRRIAGGMDIGRIEFVAKEATARDIDSVAANLAVAQADEKATVTHISLRHVDAVADDCFTRLCIVAAQCSCLQHFEVRWSRRPIAGVLEGICKVLRSCPSLTSLMLYGCECTNSREVRNLFQSIAASAVKRLTIDYMLPEGREPPPPAAEETAAGCSGGELADQVADGIAALIRAGHISHVTLTDDYRGAPLLALARAIGASRSMVSVEFSGYALDWPGSVEGVTALAAGAAQCPALRSFSLNNCTLFTEAAADEVRTQLVERSLTLRKLSIANNHNRSRRSDLPRPIGPRAALALVRACCGSPSVTSLYLYGAGLAPGNTEELCSLVAQAVSLRDLRLRYWAKAYEDSYIGHPQIDEKQKPSTAAASSSQAKGATTGAATADPVPNTTRVMSALAGCDRWQNALKLAGLIPPQPGASKLTSSSGLPADAPATSAQGPAASAPMAVPVPVPGELGIRGAIALAKVLAHAGGASAPHRPDAVYTACADALVTSLRRGAADQVLAAASAAAGVIHCSRNEALGPRQRLPALLLTEAMEAKGVTSAAAELLPRPLASRWAELASVLEQIIK